MNKIIFTSPFFNCPPAGGPELRAYNSLITLSEISELYFLVQTPRESLAGMKGKKVGKKILKRTFILFPNNQLYIIRKILGAISMVFPKTWTYIKNVIQSSQIVNYAHGKKIDIIWFAHGSVSFDLIKQVRSRDSNIRLVCDTDSVWSKFILRRIKFESEPQRIAAIRKEGNNKKLEERNLVNICDVITAVSEDEKKYYERISNAKQKIKLFPNVIKPADYNNSSKVQGVPTGKYIYLSGTFWHESPMEDAAIWLIKKVMPIVRSKIPGIKLLIVGKGADAILSKYSKEENIFIRGRVKSTIPYLKHSQIALVPLRYESGTRFKILEAGICLTPVVSTTLGAEGLAIKNEHDAIIADTPMEFANAIIELYSNPHKAKMLSRNLEQIVKNKYTTKSLSDAGSKILNYLER